MATGPSRFFQRRCTILRTTGAGGALWAAVRPAGPIGHAVLAGDAVAIGPPLGGGPGDVEHRRGVADRPAVLDDRLRELETVARSQGGISVGHQDLRVRVVGAFSSSTPRPEVLPPQDRSVRSCGHTPSTNVAGQYKAIRTGTLIQ
jgi:hypothetical protein